jgi:prepilin-type N-terminal cleavage/methylation domain-containing protein
MEGYVMLQTALKDKKGLTLVEVMISLVVLLLVFLALLQTALVSIDSNMTNVLRDEAVNIAEEQMNVARNTAFSNLAVAPPAPVLLPLEQRSIRNIVAFTYTVTRTVTLVNADTKQVVINVTWDWKDRTAANGDPYTHTISGILRSK